MWGTRFDPWVGKIRWRREWQPIPVFFPGESHGQRSLEGYSPWDFKELDKTELLRHTHTHTHTHTHREHGVVGREEGKWAKSDKLLPNSKESHVSWYRFSTWSFGQWKLTDIYKQESDKIGLCLRTKLWGLCGGWARFGERLAIGDTWEAIAVIKMRVNKSLV